MAFSPFAPIPANDTDIRTAGATRDPAVVRGADIAILARILDPRVCLALWERCRPAGLGWVDRLDWAAIDDIDATIEGPNFAAAIARLLQESGYPQDDDGRALMGEMSRLAGSFARLMRSGRLRVRLEVIETDACRKFHSDHVTARLLMPLAGPGTQWIRASDGADAPIHQLSAGHVALFKGRLWAPEPAILHRSPPVAATGETRLLLAIDPIFAD